MSENKHPGMVLIVGKGLVAEAVAERYARMHPDKKWFIPLVVLDREEAPELPPVPDPVPQPTMWFAPAPRHNRKRHPNPYHRHGHPRR